MTTGFGIALLLMGIRPNIRSPSTVGRHENADLAGSRDERSMRDLD
jgi:hypothetical protein